MKKLLVSCVSFFIACSLLAQGRDDKRSGFHLSFIPPLSTHGSAAGEYTNAVSFSLLAGVSKNEEAFSFAGLANLVGQDARGFQLAGLFNYAGNNGNGLMFSGLANVVGNDYRGFQLGGLSNVAGRLSGFQLGGLGNIAGEVNGFQFGGLFNIAKNVSGVQLAGLLNVAENSDYPIALVNVIKNGEYGLAFTYNETGSAMLTFRSGGGVTYGILGVGYNHKTKDKGFSIEGGFGAHTNLNPWLRLNHEIKGGTIGDFSDASTFYANYALMPAFRWHHVELFGGPSINFMYTEQVENKSMFPKNALWKKHTASQLKQLYIGYQIGVQFIFR